MADIKSVVDYTADKAQYDEYAKRLLSMKPILAWILIYTIDEFSGMDPSEVVQLIEDDVSIGSIPVEPGFTNEEDETENLFINGMNTESKIPHEGVRFYDILFYVCSADRRSKVIVNIEAQKDEPSKYDVEMRGIYYAARELTSELDRDFQGDDYNSMEKVYSIWICMNNREDSIGEIHLMQDIVMGNPRWKKLYEVLNITIIRMRNQLDPDSNHELHRLLGALFVIGLMPQERMHILEGEFGIQTEGKEMSGMSNLGQGIWEQGMKEGIALGQEQGIIKSVRKLLDHGMSDTTVMGLLGVTKEQIEEAKNISD